MDNELPSWADAELTHELPHLAAASETQTVEFKREFPKHAGDLAKEIAAFATSNAGMILLGVEDSGEIIGIRRVFLSKALPASRAVRNATPGDFQQGSSALLGRKKDQRVC
ncbi:helix-turn-helix domain-containing protein [Novosphingobium sp. P6W]|jgi:predicted HTH transcriptional regulator|uniref:AlbA family DNA-binding domain-containing protein n=1 Tax=Novosphingobium sp. P6W TaxID=1609758 RepID=UPI0005C2F2F9|nr:ATP-binding protein [Novosphingobium sp. P6W]AXB80068.1 ATP-binding protein [Novosphingobium sp. P6W]KIS30257.1 hypothetical protein TQ38_23705 [Novosphingobium sp. P6W]